MRITSLAMQGMRGWPDIELTSLSAGLNVVSGPSASGKTALAELLGHAIYGKLPVVATAQTLAPEGEAIIEAAGGRFRLRRYHDGTQLGRLTVASLNGDAIDRDTVRRMLGGVSPSLLSAYLTINFASAGRLDDTAAAEFALHLQALNGMGFEPGRRTTELAARRDALAHELETRIANDRRASGELEQRRRELEHQIRETEQAAATLELRLRSCESALSETDARLRYRRLELNVELRWQATETDDWESQLRELDAEISRWRATLADLAQREAAVRTRLSQLAAEETSAATQSDQRAWSAVARQLAADLEGEVARLARASASQKCVCGDAHPRLRPMVETLTRQLDRLDAIIESQNRTATAGEWRAEAAHLARSQAELRQQLEHLLDRRQALIRDAAPSRRRVHEEVAPEANDLDGTRFHSFSAADAEQLEQRRLELEQQRFELVGSLRNRQHELKHLRIERAEIERQRAALLSARSIEHVQRELAAVQRKLEQTANGAVSGIETEIWQDGACRASDFLAQLSDGRLLRLELSADGRGARAIRQTGESVPFRTLSAAESDQVRLAFSLAIAVAIARQGVRLPLVLDEPFQHIREARDIAAVAAVLDAFARQGHQVFVFTGQVDGIHRLTSLGAPLFDLVKLRRWRTLVDPPADSATNAEPVLDSSPAPQRRVRPVEGRKIKATDMAEGRSPNNERRKIRRTRAATKKAHDGERGAA
jgi:DNA repair exonuclease SbcCD ATPase subunit